MSSIYENRISRIVPISTDTQSAASTHQIVDIEIGKPRPGELILQHHVERRAILVNLIHRHHFLQHPSRQKRVVLGLVRPIQVRTNIVRWSGVFGCQVQGRNVEQNKVARAVVVKPGDLRVDAVNVGCDVGAWEKQTLSAHQRFIQECVAAVDC